MSEFNINIRDLDSSGEKEWTFPITRHWLTDALEGTGLAPKPSASQDSTLGTVRVQAQRSGQDVVLKTHIETEVRGACSRCLDDVSIDVKVDVSSLMTPRATLEPALKELDVNPEDMDRDTFDGDQIAVDSLVREHILLEEPMQIDCGRGCEPIRVPPQIRGAHGDADSIDPRLAPLREIQLNRKE